MTPKNVNIGLSGVTDLLSNYILDILHEIDGKTRTVLKEMASYLKFQIKFLMQFNYTKVNIKNHLMEKAALFFGFDFREDDAIKKRKRVGTKINRFKKKLNEQLTTEHKSPNRKLFRKKSIKKEANFYRAPE